MKPKTNSAPDLRFPEFLDEWIQTSLGTTEVKIVDGDRGLNYPNANDLLEDGFCLFLNAKNVTRGGFVFTDSTFISKEKDEKLRKGKLKRDDIVLTTRGTVGNVAYYNETVPFDHIRINSGMVLIRNESKNIDSRFLYMSFFSPNLRKQISTIAFGSAQPALTVGEINKFKISLPSATEQQKIAAFLSAVDEKVRQLAEKKELLLEYKKGVTEQIFNRQIRFKDDNGSSFPDWQEKQIIEIAPLQRGFDLPVEKIIEGEFPVVFSNGILRTHSEAKAKAPGVVTGRSGTIGKVIYVEKDYWPHNTSLWVTDFKGNHPKFIFYFYLNFKLERFGTGSGVPTLNRNDIHNQKVLIPTPPEQIKIADFIFAIDEKINLVTQQLGKMKAFKKGLLQQMFV